MISLKEKFSLKEKLNLFIASWGKPALTFFLGFILSSFKLGSSFYPLGSAFLASCPVEFFPFSLLGTVTGTFIFLIGRNSLRYLASLILITGIRYLLFHLSKREGDIFCGFISSLSLLFTSVPFILNEKSASLLLLYSGEAMTAFCCSVIFKKSFSCLRKDAPLNSASFLSLGISLGLLYMSLLPFKISFFTPVRALASAIIFSSCSALNPSLPLSLSIIFSSGGFLAGDISSLLIFPAGALASCAFMGAGKLFSAFAFIFVSVFFKIINGADISIFYTFSEVLAGIILSSLIPSCLLEKISLRNGKISDESMNSLSSYRLLKTSEALREIGEITGKVSKEVEKLHGEPMEKFIGDSIKSSCRKCKNSSTCYQRYYSRTMEEMKKLFIDGKNNLPLDMEKFKSTTGCIRCDKVEYFIRENAKKYSDFLKEKNCSQSIRYIMCDQFSGMSDLLFSLYEDVSSLKAVESKEREEINSVAKKQGALNEGHFALRDKEGNILISFLFYEKDLKGKDLEALTLSFSQCVKAPLSKPFEERLENTARLTWKTAPAFSFESDYFHVASQNRSICGDSFLSSSDLLGNPAFILSDGMGVGGDAALDSCMTTELLSRLISSGASFSSALKLVSSSLLSLKEERLCTVDLLSADLLGGTLTFYKAGSAPSYILREGKCFKIGKSALPAGILGGAEAAKSVFSLKNNDLVLMVTDGVTETGEDWILTTLPPLKDLAPLDICREIIDLASKRSLTGRCDDMTASVIKFKEA